MRRNGQVDLAEGTGRRRRVTGRREARRWLAAMAAGSALLLAACGRGAQDAQGLSGTIRIDGSSTVYPITQAVAEEFMIEHPGVNITVGVSGTGGGFQKFTRGETDISTPPGPSKPTNRPRRRKRGSSTRSCRSPWTASRSWCIRRTTGSIT